MNRFWLVVAGIFVIGGGTLLGLSMIPEERVRDEATTSLAEAEDEALTVQGLATAKKSEKNADRWKGAPEDHPAARLRKNRMERARLGVSPRQARNQASRRRSLWEQEFGRAALIRAGYAPEEIDRLEAQYEASRDQVLRELGLGPYAQGGAAPGFAEEKRAQEALSDLVGDVNDYDALLFATGQPNRVEVKDVMPLGRSHGLKPGDLFWEYNGNRIFPHDGYLPRMRADQAQGLVQPVIVYRPDVGFFPIYMQPDKQGWGVSTRPVTRVPGQESEPTGD